MGNLKMNPTASPLQQPPAVSASWRLFSALLFSALIAVTLMMPFVVWRRGTEVALLHGLVTLPAILWATRRSWIAAVRGIAPNNKSWPFASPRITYGYFVILLLVSIFVREGSR
jgi:hypothetical protein